MTYVIIVSDRQHTCSIIGAWSDGGVHCLHIRSRQQPHRPDPDDSGTCECVCVFECVFVCVCLYVCVCVCVYVCVMTQGGWEGSG
jgi:hypothetical protein